MRLLALQLDLVLRRDPLPRLLKQPRERPHQPVHRRDAPFPPAEKRGHPAINSRCASVSSSARSRLSGTVMQRERIVSGRLSGCSLVSSSSE